MAKKRVGTRKLGGGSLRARVDARLSDDYAVVRRTRDELELSASIDLERRQVARIDPNYRGAETNRALELARVVCLDKQVESQLRRVGQQRGGAAVVDIAQQEQRRVCAGELHLQQLQFLGEESFCEQ